MLVLKSLLFGIYFLKIAKKNYFPVIFYLLLTQLVILSIPNIFLLLIFFVGYLLVSSPISINIFRNIILDKDIIDNYMYYYNQSYTLLYMKNIMKLLFFMIAIYFLHIIILSPFFPEDISIMTPYLYALLIYMIYIYTRVMFILPTSACEILSGLKESYSLTKNNSIKIYLLYVCLVAPYLIINLYITNIAKNSDIQYVYLVIAILLQVIFTIFNSALIGYIYKRYCVSKITNS